jgi:hypothetical protein
VHGIDHGRPHGTQRDGEQRGRLRLAEQNQPQRKPG